MKIRLSKSDISSVIAPLLRQYIGDDGTVNQLIDLFIDAELDGYHTHGLARLPRFLAEIQRGEINPHNHCVPSKATGAWEIWDGQSGIGPINAITATKRVVEIARRYGIACVSLRNTNHWLRPGYYAKLAADQGCAFIAWTNTIPNVIAYGSNRSGIGNNPITIGLPGSGDHLLLDMALSQFSYGKIAEYLDAGNLLPVAAGFDTQGELTNDPQVILQRESAAPIGLWKGGALAMALDMFAALLAGGQSTIEIGQQSGEQNVSQVFIAFDLIASYGENEYRNRAQTLFAQIKQANPGAHIPGEGAAQRRQDQLLHGIEIDAPLWQSLCDRVNTA